MDYNVLTVIRPIEESDITGFYQLALKAGIGMTSLPKNNDLLFSKIKKSLNSFININTEKEDYCFLFVLENVKDKKIIGCSGIVNVGTTNEPAYYFHLNLKDQIIQLENHYQGAAELCSLFLHPEYRVNNNGKLLSRSRLLFMLLHDKFKNKQVIAEMRGYFDKDDISPFWHEMFETKFNISSFDAIEIRSSGNKQKIIDLIGLDAININNISSDTKSKIGAVYPSTEAAKALLEKEGLKFNNYVDIIDSGPALEANINELQTVKNAKKYIVKNFLKDDKLEGHQKFILCNKKIDNFRACISEVIIEQDKMISLPESLKLVLNIDIQSSVLMMEL